MPSIFFGSKDSAVTYFTSLKEKSMLTWVALSRKLEICNSELTDWRSCKLSFPSKVGEKIHSLYGVSLPSGVQIKKDGWFIKDASIKGGHAHYEKYGEIGTAESRRKGG